MSFKKINLTRAKKLKNHLFLFAVISIFFFTSSCTKEDFTEEIKDEVITTPNSITGKHYQGKEAFNFVNEKKLNEIIGSGQYRDEYAFTIDYSEVIQIIEENVGENITIRVNHPNQKPFMFYNLVISTSLNGTTARLLEYTMTPRFFNSFSSGLTTIQEFEGLVLSQLMYTSYPCQDEEDEILIIAPYGDYNLVDSTTGTTSGINLINTGFLSGSYSGTTFSGPSPASPGSGGENDPSTFPNFTDGLGNFFNSVGSVFSDAYEWTGNTIRTIFRWIRNLFCSSCGPRYSMARGPSDPIIIIDDNAPVTTPSPAPLEPCDESQSTNFALFQVNTLVGYNPNNDLTPEVLNWWDTDASAPAKVSLLNYLNRNTTINQNNWQVFFQLVSFLMNGGDQNFIQQLLVKIHQDSSYDDYSKLKNWFFSKREGKDPLSYDESYWENPNLSFPQQDLPSWSDFDGAYPRINGLELVTLVGGQVQIAYNEYPSLSRGYCALKVSRALNYAGINIPQIITTTGNPGTVQGSDGKYYFLNAKALNMWMRETFGTNPATATTPFNIKHYHITGAEGGTNGIEFPNLISGLKGIYSMVSTNSNWASGHADLLNEDGECVFDCHLYDTPPAPIDYIDIWVLD